MFKVKSQIEFDMAHYLSGYNGKCSNIHGHRYKLIVSVKSETLHQEGQLRGMVDDFGNIKARLKEIEDLYDHKLVIEDNEDVREYIRSLFISRYAVSEACNGEEGVRIAKEQLPDLIISDVMMPVKDGFTCCREIRMQQETAHIPILILTARAEDADILQGCNSGADDYMMKPFNPEILKTKVDNLKRIYTKALMLKQESEEGEKEDAFLQQLIHIIEANLSNADFNVKMLAEQLNMSQPTLYRKVKQRSDLSVIDMIRSIRISKAATLILENRYSIQEISEMVGYSDTRTLRKHFMEQFGVSPSKYMGSTD